MRRFNHVAGVEESMPEIGIPFVGLIPPEGELYPDDPPEKELSEIEQEDTDKEDASDETDDVSQENVLDSGIDGVRYFLVEIGKWPLLTRKDEALIGARIQSAKMKVETFRRAILAGETIDPAAFGRAKDECSRAIN